MSDMQHVYTYGNNLHVYFRFIPASVQHVYTVPRASFLNSACPNRQMAVSKKQHLYGILELSYYEH